MRKYLKAFIVIAAVITFSVLTSPNVYADLGDTTLKYGMSNTDIMELQKNLSKLGFFDGDEFTNYFGDKTKQAVLNFQKSINIKQDGIAGKETIKFINIRIQQIILMEKTNFTLKLDDSGEKVEEVKSKLKELSFYGGDINKSFDIETEQAIIDFQKQQGMEPTGIADQQTLIKLYTAYDKLEADRAASSRRVAGKQLIDYAKQYLGVKYVWAGSSSKGFDCSGFTQYIFKHFGISLDHSASSQFSAGKKIEKENLEVGDLVFFTTYKAGPSHVGIYTGNNQFIHASSGNSRVIITDLGSSYYTRRYLGARRYSITPIKRDAKADK